MQLRHLSLEDEEPFDPAHFEKAELPEPLSPPQPTTSAVATNPPSNALKIFIDGCSPGLSCGANSGHKIAHAKAALLEAARPTLSERGVLARLPCTRMPVQFPPRIPPSTHDAAMAFYFRANARLFGGKQ
jgi:hypothetical protein